MSFPKVLYANTIAVSVVPVDVAVRFGFATPAAQGEGGEAEAAWVHMSPPLAKVLARALTDAVTRYEAEFGPLPDLAPEAGGGCDLCQSSTARGAAH